MMEIEISKLEDLGWKFSHFYAPGQENMYVKGNLDLRVGNYKPPVYGGNFVKVSEHENLPIAKYLMTYTGAPNRHIESLEDLKHYELTGK